jgi:hypothetical protein
MEILRWRSVVAVEVQVVCYDGSPLTEWFVEDANISAERRSLVCLVVQFDRCFTLRPRQQTVLETFMCQQRKLPVIKI